jgi:predicted phage terminase large subunit-like protein
MPEPPKLPPLAAITKELARRSLTDYARAFYPSFETPRHIEHIAQKLEAVERGEIRRLIISMPPRHGKSLLASTYFPAWYTGRHPDRFVIAASYSQDLASDFGRSVRNIVSDPLHVATFPTSQLRDDSTAAHRFNFTAGGAYFAVGRGGPLTGRGAHLLLIDDPLKDDEEARSETVRKNLKSWFGSVAFTRLMPDAAIVLIQTRWNEDDLAGWLLRDHADEGWQTITLPAFAEERDPLGRAIGEPLWPERYPTQVLEAIKRQQGSTAFAALYQQRPSPEEGGVIKRGWWKHYDALPADLDELIQSWDFAVKDNGDYVVGQAWGRKGANAYLIDQVRDRLDFPASCHALQAFSAKYPFPAKLVEDKANGPAIIATLKEQIPGLLPVKPDGDKVARAHAVTPYIEAGNVHLPYPMRAPWINDFLEECSSFPNAVHDDQVDAMTQALHRLSHGFADGFNVVGFYDRIVRRQGQST